VVIIRCATIIRFALFAAIAGTPLAEAASAQSSISISPRAVTLVTSHAQQFKATVSSSGGSAVKWMVSGVLGGNATVGTVSSNGLYTAPAVAPNSSVSVTAVELSDSHVSANASVAIVEDPAVVQAHERWLAGAAKAAAGFGCSPDLIQQLPSESVADVLHLFALSAKKGTCLVLLPISTDPGSMRYSFASGGNIDGVEVRYLSDVGRMRIWNGVEASGK
jgi:hypothetical protein